MGTWSQGVPRALVLVVATLGLGIGTARVARAQVKCEELKLKARGKLELCLQKNAAKLLDGAADASATCESKFSTALTKAGTCRYIDNGDGWSYPGPVDRWALSGHHPFQQNPTQLTDTLALVKLVLRI